MNSKLGVLLAVLAASSVAIAASCSFPEIGFDPGTGGGSTSASSSQATTTSQATTASSAASSASSTTTTTTTTGTGGSPCVGADPCDCDGDGDRAATEQCGYDGGDCNDHDPLVNSKQTKWFTKMGSNGWDYNCDGSNEFEWTVLLSCTSFLTDCDQSSTNSRWSSSPVPSCGETADYGTCQGTANGPAFCGDLAQGSRTQGCH